MTAWAVGASIFMMALRMLSTAISVEAPITRSCVLRDTIIW